MPADRRGSARAWTLHAAILSIVLYLYVFLEWLFFVTKPSFMTELGLSGKLRVLLVAPVPLVAAGVVVLLVLWLPAFVAGKRIVRRISSGAGSLIVAVVLAALFLLLVDNFTYTVLHFGIRTVADAGRYAYLFLLLVLVVFSYQIFSDFTAKCSRSAAYRATAAAAAALVAASVALAVVAHISSHSGEVSLDIDVVRLKDRPNIILISGDGLNAESMSIYGYQRATTPFLNFDADKALLCENCFSNANVSLGSLASIFTGKLPTKTRVYYPPEVLKGRDAYEHLPGILRKYGYRSIDVSSRHYTDPVEFNLKDSFDWVNFRNIKGHPASRLLESLFDEKPLFFVRTMRDRLTERLLHVLGVRRMTDPMAEVAPGRINNYRDALRIDAMLSFVDEKPSAPFFAHIHLLGTHGPAFLPRNRIFSRGQFQKTLWMVDWYDDAIVDFDQHIKYIARNMRERGILRNTLIVICADHGQRYAIGARVPLVFLFPKGEHHGRIETNVQNLDIAPTILDYLGIEQPPWMSGRSLIAPEVESHSPIFTAGLKAGASMAMSDGRSLDDFKLAPPFYSLGYVGVIICDKLYSLSLEDGVLAVSDITGHTSPCDESDLPSPQEVGQLIIKHLAENGYDTSSIRTPLSVHD